MANRTTDLEIHGLGFTGEGFHRTESGRFVSVLHTLPGDVVRVIVGEFHRGRAWAQVVEHLRRSPDHVDPRCPVYDRCSGCALRHIERENEKNWKLESIRQILKRYGPENAESTPLDWIGEQQRDHHRIRGRFRVGVRDDGIDIGFGGISTPTQITDIRRCPAHSRPLRVLIERVASVLGNRRDIAAGIEAMDLWATPTEGAVLLNVSLATRVSHVAWWEELATAISGTVICTEPGGEVHTFNGEPHLSLVQTIGTGPDARPIRVCVPYGCWLPTNPTMSRLMLTWIQAQLPAARNHLLDLCCGIGTITFGLAPLFRSITAIDEDRQAVAAVRKACANAGLGHIEARSGRIGTVLRKLRRVPMGKGGIVATINPMRSPLGSKQLRDLRALHVERIIYLGPSPVSAGKDGAVLADMGYRLERAAAIDLHPGTAKVMLGLVLKTNGSS